MLTRRGFALRAAGGFRASAVGAQGAATGRRKRTPRVDIGPAATILRLPHLGAEGGTDLAADGLQVATGTRHRGKNGPARTVIISSHGVEKGKLQASPA